MLRTNTAPQSHSSKKLNASGENFVYQILQAANLRYLLSVQFHQTFVSTHRCPRS